MRRSIRLAGGGPFVGWIEEDRGGGECIEAQIDRAPSVGGGGGRGSATPGDRGGDLQARASGTYPLAPPRASYHVFGKWRQQLEDAAPLKGLYRNTLRAFPLAGAAQVDLGWEVERTLFPPELVWENREATSLDWEQQKQMTAEHRPIPGQMKSLVHNTKPEE